jgi:hypothetical protein
MKVIEYLENNDVRRIVFMNAAILTAVGTFEFQQIDIAEATTAIHQMEMGNVNGGMGYEFLSAIGHQGSADAFNDAFSSEGCRAIHCVEVNRIKYQMQKGDLAIVVKMKERQQEGCILTSEEMNRVGYDFYALWRTA